MDILWEVAKRAVLISIADAAERSGQACRSRPSLPRSQSLQTAAYWYARNDLKVEAAGLSADDLGKAELYFNLSEREQAKWESWVVRTKRAANIYSGFFSLKSRSFGY